MLKKFNRLLGACVCLLMLSGSLASAYDYPFADPYVATILGTPKEYAYDLPKEVPLKYDTIKMFPDRKVPGILWNLDELRYSYLKQKGPAPLIFLIAGTGASFQSAKMQVMQKAFYQAGFNVVSISSPTHPNFIVAASTSGVPGHLKDDSSDLYQVMQSIWEKLQKKMEVTEFFLTGYSLGASESAFIAKLDEADKVFNFRKVLLINPPVSLYNSVNVLDKMLVDNIPGGLDNFNAFYRQLIKNLTDVYVNGDQVEFDDQFLYQAYKYRKPKSDDNLAALIGVSFRISSQNMVFASDVLTKAGYVVPKGVDLRRHDRPTEYLKVLGRLSFVDYFKGLFLPYYQAQNPNLTEADLVTMTSLKFIDDYIRTSPKFGLITNEDDLILLPGEIDYLRDLFGSRAQIFPRGGHCGNMDYPDNVTAMVDFFQASKN
ncbi:MAG: alpha/beta hydrolase [Deltaproteobacteria bacterium]|nr:MAG: alpha/beta hydrolase [Deltaproteobacteria bacterium]